MRKLWEKPETYFKYLAAIIIMAVPLYPKFPFIRIPATYVAIRLEDLLLFFGFFVLFGYLLKNKGRHLKTNIGLSILLHLGIGFLSLFSAIFVTKTVVPHIGVLHWARRFEYFVPFFIGLFLMREKKSLDLEFLLKVLMITIFGVFIYALGQKTLNWPAIITQNNEYSKGIALRQVPGGHLNATFAGHYDLATFLVLMLPMVASLFFFYKDKKTKIGLGVLFIFSLWLLAATLSRISIISYFFGIVISLLILRKFKEILIVSFLSLLVFGFSTSLLDRYIKIIEVTKKGIEKIMVIPSEVHAQGVLPERRKDSKVSATPVPIFEDRSTSIRLNVEWPRAVRSFTKNPLLGTGYSSITLATDNDYLRLLGEVGLLGFFSFFLPIFYLFFALLKALGKVAKGKSLEKTFLAGFMGGFLGILMNALFIDVFEASKFAIIFWLFAGLAYGLAKITLNEKNI